MSLDIHCFLGAKLMTAEASYALAQVRYRLTAAHIYNSRGAISLAVPAGYTQIIVKYRPWP
jgi:predicted butyrate kinase (DUF1464 family)